MHMMVQFLKLLLVALAIVAVTVVLTLIASGLADARGLVMPVLVLLLIAFAAVALPTTAMAFLPRGGPVWRLLKHLEQAVRLNLPLPQMMHAVGEAEGGGFARSVQRARDLLQRGAPLAAALGAVSSMPPRILRMIEAGERSGRLQQVLARIMQQRRAAAERSTARLFYRLYPLLLCTVLFIVGGTLIVFVMPKYQMIMRDFGLPLPPVLRGTLSAARMLASPGPLALVVLLFGLVIFSIVAGHRRRHYLTEAFADPLLNYLPLIGTVRLQRALGDALDIAADAVESGRPMDSAVAEAVEITRNSRLHDMLQEWVDGMRRGESVADSARAARMPPLVSGMLATAVHTPDVAPILRFLGRYYSARFSRSLALLRAGAVPAVALVMGFFVGWLALSVMLPLTELSQQTMSVMQEH